MEKIHNKQRAATAVHIPRRITAKPPIRRRHASPSASTVDERPDLIIQQSMDQIAVRNVFGLFSKYDKWDVSELLTTRDTHWLLTNADVYKAPTEHPAGLIRQLQAFNDSYIDVLFPVDENVSCLDAREIHQLLRELTIGVYALNAQPFLSLEANLDLSSTCQLPTAFIDTRLGQTMINCDAWLKSVWHGLFMPREKRAKFADRWRHLSEPSEERSLLHEFEAAGLQDLSQDADYANARDHFKPEPKSEEQVRSDDQFLESYADDISMVLTVYLKQVSQLKNCVLFDGDHIIQSQIKTIQDKLDNQQFQRLKALLQVHENYLRRTFSLKNEVRKNIYLLQVSCFLFSLLVGLKRRMKKIPNMNRLLPMLIGDDVRTERELPPFIYTEGQSNRIFPGSPEKMFHLHGGIQFEYETGSLNHKLSQMFKGKNDSLLDATRRTLYKYLELPNSANAEYNLPIVEIDGKKFYHLVIEIEPYYGLSPVWLRVIQKSVESAALKRFLNETVIYEMYKKYFGRKRATYYKNPEHGLRISAQRGLACIFQALARKTATSALSKANLRDGLTLMHYAAIHNRPVIIGILILLGVDVNTRAEVEYKANGGTPLHFACRHGSLDAACCLLGNLANIQTDHLGWTPIHHAAFCDHVPVIRLLYNKHSELLEQTTKDERQSTPLLLAATSGALDAVQCLVSLNANIAYKDELGNTVIHLAASNLHTNVIEYFIRLNNPLVPTWNILVDLINHPDISMKLATVRCLNIMTMHGDEFWRPLLATDGIKRLVKLLHMTDHNLILSTLSALCNISTHTEVRLAISTAEENLSEMFSHVLKINHDEIRSKASVLIADICFIPSNQERFLQADTIAGLSRMLDSPIEDVLVNACNAVDLLCRKNEYMQNELAKYGIIEKLTELLGLDSKILRGTVASALASITYNNMANQTLAASKGALKLIMELMQDREFGIRYKGSLAVEALALNNVENQRQFLSKQLNIQKPLNELMEKMYYVAATIRSSEEWALEIREQAAFSLWALGGQIKSQQRYVAECFGIPHVVTMLLSNSDKLLYISLNAVIALADESEPNQNRLYRENILSPLVRLLKQCHQLSHRVALVLVQTFSTLCTGISLAPNVLLQNAIVEQNVIELLLGLMQSTQYIDLKVECCLTLSKLVLNNNAHQQQLAHDFNVEDMVNQFSQIRELDLKLRAFLALAIFVYNNLENQCVLRKTHAVSYSLFRSFIDSSNPTHAAMACFQVIILARVIADTDDEQVTLTALAIMKLAELLQQTNISLITQIAKYVSSLARIRTGISDGLLACQVLERLIEKLYLESPPQTSEDAGDEVEMHTACAVAIGALTYNKTAFRLLYNLVRRNPTLYDKIVECGDRSCMSQEFVQFFESERVKGLPVDSLSVRLHVLDARPSSSIHRRSTFSDRQPSGRVKTARSRLQTPSTLCSTAPSMQSKRSFTLSSKLTRT